MSEVLCEPGTYCHQGVRIPCPAGQFGDRSGLSTPLCSGPCERGYFCPLESVSARQRDCGGTNLYCPGGEGTPRPVQTGQYSVGIPAMIWRSNDTWAPAVVVSRHGDGTYDIRYDEADNDGEFVVKEVNKLPPPSPLPFPSSLLLYHHYHLSSPSRPSSPITTTIIIIMIPTITVTITTTAAITFTPTTTTTTTIIILLGRAGFRACC